MKMACQKFSTKIIKLKNKQTLCRSCFRLEHCLYLWNAKLLKLGKAHSIAVFCHSNLYPLQLNQVSNILLPN